MQLRQYQSCFLFKSKSFSFTVLQLLSSDLTLFSQHLSDTITRLPNFFNNTPIIIDLEKIRQDRNLDFQVLHQILQQYGMILMGVQNGNEELHQRTLSLGYAIIAAKSKPDVIMPKPYQPTKIVNHPIRSGMQLYAKEADLIVTSQVSHGAEIMADGHIHVYGTLKGRALAGVSGNKQVSIFCKQLDAELISIAGFYLTRDEIPTQHTEGLIQINLVNDQLQINSL